jgi:mono/diheme cytochrome c family protein
MKTFWFKYLALVLCVLAAFIVVIGASQADSPKQSDLIEHGKYIATIAGCTSCHTPLRAEFLDMAKLTLPQIQTLAFNDKDAVDNSKLLAGGRLFDLGPAGKVYTKNLTPDAETGLGRWTDEQIKVAVRTGQTPSGRQLFPIMPYFTFNSMADSDLDAIVAYIRSVPAVKNEVPAATVSTEGMQPLPYAQGISAPGAADKAARGEYLVRSVSACTDCHTPIDPSTGAPMMDKYLGGGQPYEGPWGIVYGGNITPDKETGIGNHTESEIKQALLAGINNKGRRLILMPWFVYSAMTNDDADAVVYYLKNKLPPVKNEVPDASLNEAFNVLAPEPEPAPTPAANFSVPIFSGGIIILIILVAVLMRRKKQSLPKQ